MTESHDWWSNLSPFEKSRLRVEERQAEKKQAELDALKKKRGWETTKAKLELEIAGHRFFRQQLVNRGTQRAILGIKYIRIKRDREMRHAV